MTDPLQFRADREESSRRALAGDGGGNGSRYDRLLERIHHVETIVAKIDTRLESTATKADLNELQSSMLKWFIVTLIAAIAAVATVVSVIQ